MTKIVFGAGHVEGPKIYMGYNEDQNMLDLAIRKAEYAMKTYQDIEAVTMNVTGLASYDKIQLFIQGFGADLCSLEHSNADDSIYEEPNEPNRVVIYRTVKNPGDGPCKAIGEACATILNTYLAPIQHRANSAGNDWYGAIKRAMLAGCSDAWLDEHGFHTHTATRAKLLEPMVRQLLAEKEIDAMATHYGWKKKEANTVLQFGSKGPAVVEWQKRLIEWDANALPKWKADGIFGAEAVEWTNKFRAFTGYEQNGTVDDLLWNAMMTVLMKRAKEKADTEYAALYLKLGQTEATAAERLTDLQSVDGIVSKYSL